MKYIYILFALAFLPSCSGQTKPSKGKTTVKEGDSTLVFERKLSNGNETYLVKAMLHKDSENDYRSFGIYKQTPKGSWANVFYLPDEYEDSVSFNVIGENSIFLSNAAFTKNGTLLVSFIGRANHKMVVAIAPNKAPEICDVKQGCFLFDKPNDLLLFNSWEYAMDEDHPEDDGFAEMTYSLYEPGKGIKSIGIKDENPDYNDELTVCNEDNQFKTLKLKEEKMLQLISKYIKQ